MSALKRIFFPLFLVACLCAVAQVRVPNTNVSFNFPKKGWNYLHTLTNETDNALVYLYGYTGQTVLDKSGDTILPYMRIYVRPNYKGNMFELAYSRFTSQPFQSMNEYYDGIPGTEGIGYIGAYRNTNDGKDYQFRMIYFKDDDNAIEVRIETTTDTYADFDKTFDNILRTFTINKNK